MLFLFMATIGAEEGATQQKPPALLLVSFDGFRADYLQRFPMPNLELLYSQGVLVEELTNAFITKTFPNHYTLVTGLYVESHGILASSMYDPVTKKHFNNVNDTDPMWWRKAEPIWLTALDYGHKTATAMWPGSDVRIRNRTATHYFSYNRRVTFRQRLQNVTSWLLGEGEEEGVTFAALYWEEPDRAGHIFGPDNTTAMAKALKEVDDNVGLLVSELKRTGLWGRVNVIITSDHGMAQCSAERLIRLDRCLHPDSYAVVDLTPVAAIVPLIDPHAVHALLSQCHPHMTAYLKEDIPDWLHYKNNEFIQQILLVADEGWTIVQRGDKPKFLGDHGYNNSLPSMHPFMAATGPSFRVGLRTTGLRSVDLYPLMCHLLAITPRPHNGSIAAVQCLLAAEVCSRRPHVATLTVGLFLLLAVAGVVLFQLLRERRRSSVHFYRSLQAQDSDGALLIT